MATSMARKVALQPVGFFCRSFHPCSYCSVAAQHRTNASWTKFFKKEKSHKEEWSTPVRKLGPEDGPSTLSRLESLKRKEGLVTVRGYTPQENVAARISDIAESVVGEPVDPHHPLKDRAIQFQLLTRLMLEFDHFIPNTELNNMHTLDDITTFFSTPVKDRSSYEDMAKLDLPPNLHIQMEPIRFDSEQDTFFDGKNAFPGRPTIISSLKFRRKYKGNKGESRNQPNLTRYEETVMYSRKT